MLAAPGGEGFMALLDHELSQGVADRLFVVHYEDGYRSVGQGHTLSETAGRSRTVKLNTPARERPPAGANGLRRGVAGSYYPTNSTATRSGITPA